jgi:uncharacterized membrane-anchored protein
MTNQITANNLAGNTPAVEHNRVPIPTWDFWIVKLLAVTVGETFADLIAADMGLGLTNTTILMGAILAGLLVMQFAQRRYIPVWYWLTVVFVSIEGTLITDKLVDDMGVTLGTTTVVFGMALAATFAVWYMVEKTLSIHNVTNFRREAFYWLAILLTFALGTSAGDQAAEAMGMGYLPAALMYAAVIAVVTACYYVFKLNAIFAFWAAYIITRPAGASLGDWLSQPADATGLGLGTTLTSVIFLVLIGLTIYYMTLTKDGDEIVTKSA